MGHRLQPHDGMPYLTPSEVMDRLRDAFARVDANLDAGADHVGDMIAHLLRMKVGYERWKEPPPHAARIADQITRLEAVRSQAVHVVITENPADENNSLSFAVIPGEDILIGYADAQHEQVATPLVARVAGALNYSMELV